MIQWDEMSYELRSKELIFLTFDEREKNSRKSISTIFIWMIDNIYVVQSSTQGKKFD